MYTYLGSDIISASFELGLYFITNPPFSIRVSLPALAKLISNIINNKNKVNSLILLNLNNKNIFFFLI